MLHIYFIYMVSSMQNQFVFKSIGWKLTSSQILKDVLHMLSTDWKHSGHHSMPTLCLPWNSQSYFSKSALSWFEFHILPYLYAVTCWVSALNNLFLTPRGIIR